MGYTHYWKVSETIDTATWREIAKFARYEIDLAIKGGMAISVEFDEPNTPAEINEAWIRFNGVGSDGHETFLLGREASEFSFCKTNRKPYDEVVEAVLNYADDLGAIEWSHDQT